jgi:tryptophan-rich sensory protein
MKRKKGKPAPRRGWLGKLGMLVACILIPQLAGGIGSLATMSEIPTWYAGLQKPSFNPPNWIFGPVWGSLFLLMGISLYLVVKRGIARHRTAVGVFGLQLALNVLWSVLFFGMHRPDYSLVEIAALLAAIIWNAVLFYRITPWAGLLLVPYACWVSFASFLNFTIWRLNRPF